MRLPRNLTRVMSPGRRLIPQVDGLRFVAISAVVLYHVAPAMQRYGRVVGSPGAALQLLMGTGDYGVELFFVISGFLLGLPFARTFLAGAPRVSLKSYFLRRVTRLEPPYVLILLATFALDAATGIGPVAERASHLLTGLVYQHGSIDASLNPIIEAAWSLEVEVQFYILTPLLAAAAFAVRSRVVRRVSIAVAMVCLAALRMSSSNYRLMVSLPGHLHEFLAGYLLADVYVTDWKESPPKSGRWDAVTVVGWPVLVALVLHRRIAQPVLPFAILLLYCAALRGRISRAVFGQPWGVAVGGMCYTIYLTHQAVLRYLSMAAAPHLVGLSFTQGFAVCCALFVPAVLLVSIALFVVLERPCMDPSWPSMLAARFRALIVRSEPAVD